MDEMGIEAARPKLGEVIDRVRFTGRPVRITRQGKRAAVVVSDTWYEAALAALRDSGYPLSKEQAALVRAFEAADAAGVPFVADLPRSHREASSPETTEEGQ